MISPRRKRLAMKALSVRQPWASLIASGRKSIELRTWSTAYRGPILIAASRQVERAWAEYWSGEVGELPTGVALCVVEIADVRAASFQDAGNACVFSRMIDPGLQYAWVLERPQRIRPFDLKGRLGLFSTEFPYSRLVYVGDVARER